MITFDQDYEIYIMDSWDIVGSHFGKISINENFDQIHRLAWLYHVDDW